MAKERKRENVWEQEATLKFTLSETGNDNRQNWTRRQWEAARESGLLRCKCLLPARLESLALTLNHLGRVACRVVTPAPHKDILRDKDDNFKLQLHLKSKAGSV